RELVAHLFQPARPSLIRPEARQLVADARADGHAVAVLTNDLTAFHSQEWIDKIDFIREVDLVVDGSIEGVLKPNPRLYQILAERLGVQFEGMVFVDDQMSNIRGATELSINA